MIIIDQLQIFVSNLRLISTTEILLILCCLAISFVAGKFLVNLIKIATRRTIFSHFLRATVSLITPTITIAILFLGLSTQYFLDINSVLTIPLLKLVIAWFAIVLVKLLATRRSTGWFVAIVIVPITVLNLFGLWEPCVAYLDSIDFTIAKVSLSVYQILKTLFIVIALFKLTKFITRISEERLRRLRRIKSSDKVLILKVIQIAIYFIILLIALDQLGINITTLAVFSGAVGVGLGFGLQKITSNFISGIIILLEKSIEVDDMVELSDGTNGMVKRTGARYILIETLQGKEVLVPNEDFITQRVINWTYTSHKCRIEIPISVSYGTDLEFARNIILEATQSCACIAKTPKPECYLREFSLNSINFLLLFWIEDVIKGRYEPQSDVMFAIWKKFKEHGIEMPYSQIDVHIKPMSDKKIR
jgi:small-conductance mechanosensitive channel